ncbi:hypothetical protein MTYP_01672 [Methylophilaceae bacterium]|nr:hypothetical protein MTYP_01672 [Methylophilaceae bacterium]
MYFKLKSINQLSLLSNQVQQWDETIDHLTITGTLTETILNHLIATLQAFTDEAIEHPSLMVDAEPEDIDSLKNLLKTPIQESTTEWRLSLHKGRLLIDENHKIFIMSKAFVDWANQLTPTHTLGCDFNKPLTIFIKGLAEAFGGPSLRFIPVDAEDFVPPQTTAILPDESQVRSIVRVTSSNHLYLNPSSIALSWGNREQPEALPFKRFFMAVMTLCFAQEVYVRNDEIRVILRGTKNLDSRLTPNWMFNISTKAIDDTATAVSWMFQERVETRQRLLSDRLSLDIIGNSSFINGVSEHINNALDQAKERYGFVILDRKDAYLKELKEVMKDVRTQADLYAGKVRDLVSTLLRDALAVLFLVGVSLIARLNTSEVATLVNSSQLFIFFKVLAIYFLVSMALQICSHTRDLILAKNECERWMQLTHDYLTKEIVDENFTKPLIKRKNMFYTFASISFFIYIALAGLSWNAEYLVKNYSKKNSPINIEETSPGASSKRTVPVVEPMLDKIKSAEKIIMKDAHSKIPKKP